MSKPEWGIKRVCPSCSTKYYDFNKNPIICPKCEFEFDPDLLLKSRKGRSIATKTEDNTVVNDIEKEKEIIEDNINLIENNEEILDIDEDTDLQNDDNIQHNINDDADDDLEIIDDDLDEKDNFSVEINDEIDQSDDEEK